MVEGSLEQAVRMAENVGRGFDPPRVRARKIAAPIINRGRLAGRSSDRQNHARDDAWDGHRQDHVANRLPVRRPQCVRGVPDRRWNRSQRLRATRQSRPASISSASVMAPDSTVRPKGERQSRPT